MLQDTTTEQMEHILSNIERSVNAYNNTTDGPEMSYSVGYATSSDYTSASADFLFKEADKKMYCMKQEWHRTHQK
jgi:GGDEF domain-containing protein